MSKETWFETYFREIGLVVLVAFLTVCLMIGADKETVNGSIYSVVGLIIASVLFCGYTIMLGSGAPASGIVNRLRLVSAVSALIAFGALIAYSTRIQQHFAADEAIRLAMCGVVCALTCGWYLDWRHAKLKDLEMLRENRYDEYLRKLIKDKRRLTDEQQLKLFYLPDAEQLLFQYMQYEDLDSGSEQKIIEQPYIERLLTHLPSYAFTDAGDARLFQQPNAPSLVKKYVENGNAFSDANDVKMFDLPNAAEVVEIYIQENYLSSAAELRLFELPNAEELVKEYLEEYDLCDEALQLAKEKGWA